MEAEGHIAHLLPDVARSVKLVRVILLKSLPGSRDCPHLETLSLVSSSHLRPRSYKHVNHLLLFSSSLSTRTSMRDDLMCSVDRAVDRFVAAVHLCPNILPLTEATECAGEIETGCAEFAAASRSF
jgi:hypothetical protein